PSRRTEARPQQTGTPRAPAEETNAGRFSLLARSSRLYITCPVHTTYRGISKPRVSRKIPGRSRSQRSNQMLNLFIHVPRIADGVRDFTAQHIPMAQPQPVHG